MNLEVNTIPIPLPQDLSLPLVMRSPLFDDDEGKTPGSFIFPTTLPATPELQRAVGYLHRVNKQGAPTGEFTYKLSAGVMRWEGTGNVTQCDADHYELSFNITTGNLAVSLTDKTLKNIDFGGDIIITDVSSFAGLSAEIIVHQFGEPGIDDYPYTFSITNAPNKILYDFTDSLSNSGKTFTAKKDLNCSLKIDIGCSFESGLGEILLNIFKNGISILAEIIDFETTVATGGASFIIPLILLTGDIITIEILGRTESQFPTQADFTIYEFTAEYAAGTIFDTVCQGDQNSHDYAIFPVENPEFFSNFPDDHFLLDNRSIKELYSTYFPVQNYYKDGNFPMILKGSVEGEFISAANLFTPFVYFKVLINKIAAAAGFQIENSPYAGNESSANKFYNAVLYYPFAENTYSQGDTNITPVKATFNLSDHVPAMNQGEFLREAAKVAGMRLLVDDRDRTITFLSLQEQMAMAPIPFPGLVLEKQSVKISREYNGIRFEFKPASRDKYISDNIKERDPKVKYKGAVSDMFQLSGITGQKVDDSYLVVTMNELYIWRYDPETYLFAWIFYSKNFFFAYQEGVEPFLTISNEFCPVISRRNTVDASICAYPNRMWLVPVTWQPGIMEGVPGDDTEFSMQILFFRGLQLDSLGHAYPLGTAGNKNYNGEVFEWSAAICAAGDDANMYINAHKAWMEWLAYKAKPVKIFALFTPAQLRALKMHIPQRMDGSVILLKELRLNITNDGLSVAEMDCYTLA